MFLRNYSKQKVFKVCIILKKICPVFYDVQVSNDVEHRLASQLRNRQLARLDESEEEKIEEKDADNRLYMQIKQKLPQLLFAEMPFLPPLKALPSTIPPVPPADRSIKIGRPSGSTDVAGGQGDQYPDRIKNTAS